MHDPELAELLRRESEYYLGTVDLIAASNAPTWNVRRNLRWGVAQFRSAEGMPGKRPYAGTENFDAIENLTISRARSLFGAEHANVQPLSGSLANLAAFRALLSAGDTILSMSLQSGGHLTHGHPRHIVSDLYHVVWYSVDRATGFLDYNQIRDIALRTRPRVIVAGSSSYPRIIDFSAIARICEETGATLVADVSHIAGLVVSKLHPNPCEMGAVTTTSVEKTLRGTRGGLVLCRAALAGTIDRAVFPGLQSSVGLAGLVSLAHALRDAQTEEFREYQRQVVANARALAETLVAGSIPVLTGGTDTHLVLLDVSRLGLSGRAAEARLSSISILSNRNSIPFDPLPPFEASGLRLGTPTITSRGFSLEEVKEVGSIISDALRSRDWGVEHSKRFGARVADLAARRRAGDTLGDLLNDSSERTVEAQWKAAYE